MLGGLGLAEETGGLTVHPYWVVVSIIQFLLLFYLLRRFLWGPILRTLQDRATRIREGLAAAEAARAERERMTEEVERLLAQARQQAGEIADRTRQRAQVDAKQLHDQALAQLRSEVAGMVVLAAGRVLGREVSLDQHRALIEESLDEAGASLDGPR